MEDYSSMNDAEFLKLLGASPEVNKNLSSMSDDEFLKALQNEELPKERNEWVGMGSSVGGALAGAALGSVVPVVGTAIGGVVGGALGAFGGELLEDELQGVDLDFANAAKEGVISAGIDVATLGTMKFAKPAYFAGKRALGFTAKEVSEDIIQKAAATQVTQKAGTQLSLVSTSKLLAEKGGVLTPSQIPTASGVDKFYENIGRGGIMSGKAFDENMVKVNEAVSGAINDMVTRNNASVLVKGELGQSVTNIFSEAKTALSKQYELGLDSVMGQLKNDMLDVTPIHNSLDTLLKSKSIKLGGSSLQKETTRLLNELKSDLGAGLPVDVPVLAATTGRGALAGRSVQKTVGNKKVTQPIPAVQLIQWQKKVNKMITEMGNPQSPMYNGVIDAELVRASKTLGGAIDSVMKKTNKTAYNEYLQVKKQYGKGIAAIKPLAIKGLVNSASKQDYEGLGKVLLSKSNNYSKFTESLKAIKYSVNTMKPAQLKSLGFNSKKEVFDTIKASYVKDLFPDISSTSFDVATYARSMSKLTPEQVKQAKDVLGKDYGRFNQIRNAIIDSADKSSTDVGLLSLRSKELNVVSSVGAASVTGVIGALPILFAPKVMAKIALSPKKSAQLINLMSRASTTPEGLSQTQKAIALLIAETADTAVDVEN